MKGTITGVGVLDKGVAIINSVEFHPRTASDLARELDMTLSTAHRLAMAMTAHGLLYRDAQGFFQLGQRFGTTALTEVARPVLQRLSEDTSETTQLWLLRGDVRVCAASVDSRLELRATLPVGSQLPLSAGGSAARVLLGEPSTHGWIESISQRTVGLGSVSAPIRLHDEIVAALCVAAPLPRVHPSPGAQFGAQVVAAAAEVAAGLPG